MENGVAECADTPPPDQPIPMPRKATSPAEFDQIARVRSLLRGFRLVPSAELHVTTTARRTFVGHLVRDQVGSAATRRGERAYYGSIVLLTRTGQVDIDYLDIVWIDGTHAAARTAVASEPPCEAQDSSGMLSS
jgi:hypothetical protein